MGSFRCHCKRLPRLFRTPITQRVYHSRRIRRRCVFWQGQTSVRQLPLRPSWQVTAIYSSSHLRLRLRWPSSLRIYLSPFLQVFVQGPRSHAVRESYVHSAFHRVAEELCCSTHYSGQGMPWVSSMILTARTSRKTLVRAKTDVRHPSSSRSPAHPAQGQSPPKHPSSRTRPPRLRHRARKLRHEG